ncbi:hypothetical protein PMAYCL1PPCAC_17081, partial [Pristionchus mayeri]
SRFFNCLFNYGPDEETIVYVQEFLHKDFTGEGQNFIGALYFSTEGEFRMRAFMATMGFNSIMAVCMSVIVSCSYFIIAHFRSKNVQWSGKTKKMQQHLFYTLVIQMIIPMVFVYFPCAGIINLPMLGCRLNVFPNLVSASLTFFPLIDAFIIMFGVPMSPSLREFTAPNQLRELVEFLTGGGQLNDRFENFALQNISKWILAGGFPKGHMRIFGYPADEPYYVYFVEENHPHIQGRTPSGGHDRKLLKQSLRAMLEMLTPELEKHGQLLLEADYSSNGIFLELQSEGAPFDSVYADGVFIPFFMDEEQKRKIVDIEFKAPEGYRIDSVDIAEDSETMHSVWPFRALSPLEILRYRLESLPSVCMKSDEGDLAAWELSHSFGQITHLFTLEPHRGKGLGLLAENLMAQVFAREGLQVYKYVVDHNVDVVRGTMKHPLWSTWKSVKNGKESDEKEEDILWSFNIFKYRRGKEN